MPATLKASDGTRTSPKASTKEMHQSRPHNPININDIHLQEASRPHHFNSKAQPTVPTLRPSQPFHHQQSQHSLTAVSSTLRYLVSADRTTSPASPTRSASEASYSDRVSPTLSELQDDRSPSPIPRLPPILQVEKQEVTTSATLVASAKRRRNEAAFQCPVPGCSSSFTRRFNLKGHLRSHTSERPYICEWPGCGKGFARQHDCKRHHKLHSPKSGTHECQGCGKSFSRTDALNRHLRSESGADCRVRHRAAIAKGASSSNVAGPSGYRREEEWEIVDEGSATDRTSSSRPPSVS